MQLTNYENDRKVILLIDGIIGYEHVIEYLRKDFSIIEVRIDPERVEDDLDELEAYIIERYDGQIDYAYGTDIVLTSTVSARSTSSREKNSIKNSLLPLLFGCFLMIYIITYFPLASIELT